MRSELADQVQELRGVLELCIGRNARQLRSLQLAAPLCLMRLLRMEHPENPEREDPGYHKLLPDINAPCSNTRVELPSCQIMPRISKGLTQAYQLQDFTFEAAMSLRESLPRAIVSLHSD